VIGTQEKDNASQDTGGGCLKFISSEDLNSILFSCLVSDGKIKTGYIFNLYGSDPKGARTTKKGEERLDFLMNLKE
jgi:hypothetical protein